MPLNQQLIALYTIVRREWIRMFRIATQVFLPPVITSLLYFLIFGQVIGSRIGSIAGMDYMVFITPGLVMMGVISNAYTNVSTSLFSTRFQKNIEEILISPMHNGYLMLGFVLGGVLRGFLVAIFTLIVASFFMHVNLACLPLTLVVVTLVAALFSLAGFTNGMLARNFDDVAIVPTFILTPLTYLGGVFYSITMLPPFWQNLSRFNPIFYMVDALRSAMIPNHTTNLGLSILFIGAMLLGLTLTNLYLLKKGTGLRD